MYTPRQTSHFTVDGDISNELLNISQGAFDQDGQIRSEQLLPVNILLDDEFANRGLVTATKNLQRLLVPPPPHHKDRFNIRAFLASGEVHPLPTLLVPVVDVLTAEWHGCTGRGSILERAGERDGPR